jgi:hypothetical protein
MAGCAVIVGGTGAVRERAVGKGGGAASRSSASLATASRNIGELA